MLIDCSICALFLFTEIESDGKNIEKGKYEHNSFVCGYPILRARGYICGQL
jgi:hypothetical protein